MTTILTEISRPTPSLPAAPRGPVIQLEGGILGPDILERLAEGNHAGQRPSDFGLPTNRSLLDEVAAIYRDARDLFAVFQRGLERHPQDDRATGLTRARWMVPFLGLLGYDLRSNACPYDLGGTAFAISHRAGDNEDAPPVHIVGARQPLGRVDSTSRPRLSPHALLQEFLNGSDHLWGLVTNGLELRLLRQSTLLRRQAYVAFDLEAILDPQADRFQEFLLLYRLLHRTRLPKGVADAHECWLERYHQQAMDQGNRARDRLRDGVEQALLLLGNGFLRANPSRPASPQEFYQHLLRLVYRFLFLLVAEDRRLLTGNDLYRNHYSPGRLRRLVDRHEAYTDHDDLWCSLRVLWHLLRNDKSCPSIENQPLVTLLELPVLNGDLFTAIELEDWTISNRDLLVAFRNLVYYFDEETKTPRRVNYAALDVEELGSVYESLLDNHPQIGEVQGRRQFRFAEGTERKSTGSYYTPRELVAELIKSALEPVLQERLAEAMRMANGEWRMVPKQIQERFVDEILQRLPRSRSLATCPSSGQADLRDDPGLPRSGALRYDQPTAPSSNLDLSKHRGGMGKAVPGGVHSIPAPGQWESGGIGDPSLVERRGRLGDEDSGGTPVARTGDPGQAIGQSGTKHPTQEVLAKRWKETPFAIRYSLFAQHALLSLRVLDPACGSGHFLLAAARRLGRELARIRTGEDEPSPDAIREAVREVITHCIYGVDKNPLAVDLCK
ncbi:MAG: hypothetical protein WHU94_10985, partial [Thermogemmata sp.]